MKNNVFEQIGFSPEEAASLKMKSPVFIERKREEKASWGNKEEGHIHQAMPLGCPLPCCNVR